MKGKGKVIDQFIPLNFCVSALLLLAFCSFPKPVSAQQASFSNATIFIRAESHELTQKGAEMLQEEVEKRTSFKLPITSSPVFKNNPTIVLGLEAEILSLRQDFKTALNALAATADEGYKIVMLEDEQTVLVAGNDERGVIYGVGYLLRKMEMRKNEVLIPNSLSVSSTPKFPIRGHHITYHFNKKSSIQEKALFEQYLRELMYFGLNHASVSTPEEAQMCKEYGVDVSMYMANVRGDFESPDGIRKELDRREKIFRSMPKLNEIFVPAGDPGDLEPEVLFNWLEKLAPVLLKYHPNAKIWVSAQNNNKGKATQEWYDGFYERVNRNYYWFGGVVFGPWVRTPIEDMRKIVRNDIPIRRFPDITHLFGCQYPAPELDLVFSHTLGRMSIQPRPIGFKHIHNLYADLVIGSRPYSEGNSDDVNKIVWSDQDWNPETPVIETLRDYACFFIGPDYVEGFALGMLALEGNIKGPLIHNDNVEETLLQWQDMENVAEPAVLQNPRFQTGLIRAYYDAYQQQRLIYETFLENKAYEFLRKPDKSGALSAVEKATNILLQATDEPVCQDYKIKISELYHSLFRGPEPRWMSEFQKCEFFENIDVPLNSSEWLLAQFDSIKKAPTEKERLQQIETLLQRNNPRAGGFYVNMGTEASFKRIISKRTSEDDPGSQIYPRRNYIRGSVPMPASWKLQMATLYEQPLVMGFENLDSGSNYNIRINYTGGIGRGQSKMKLMADGEYIVHDFINTEGKPLQEFPIPKEALQDGKIELSWTCGKGERGSPVAEVWLIKQSNTAFIHGE